MISLARCGEKIIATRMTCKEICLMYLWLTRHRSIGVKVTIMFETIDQKKTDLPASAASFFLLHIIKPLVTFN